MSGGSPKYGVNWAYGYAIVRPRPNLCGYITNPDADTIVDLVPCNEPATYEFRFEGETAIWNSACTAHADVVRRFAQIEQIRSIPGTGGGDV